MLSTQDSMNTGYTESKTNTISRQTRVITILTGIRRNEVQEQDDGIAWGAQ
jgi:phage antirepressor YoqD-like protein